MIGTAPKSDTRDDTQLLDKHAIERMTSLDITTIYRKMSAGTFPQPVKVGRRRVAWRTSDIIRWQQELEVGTETTNEGRAGSAMGIPEQDAKVAAVAVELSAAMHPTFNWM